VNLFDGRDCAESHEGWPVHRLHERGPPQRSQDAHQRRPVRSRGSGRLRRASERVAPRPVPAGRHRQSFQDDANHLPTPACWDSVLGALGHASEHDCCKSRGNLPGPSLEKRGSSLEDFPQNGDGGGRINRSSPVRISWRVTPSEYTSDRQSIISLRAWTCSGTCTAGFGEVPSWWRRSLADQAEIGLQGPENTSVLST